MSRRGKNGGAQKGMECETKRAGEQGGKQLWKTGKKVEEPGLKDTLYLCAV